MSVVETNERVKWLKLFRIDGKNKLMDLTDPNPIPTLFDPDEEGARTPRFSFNYVKYDEETHHATAKTTHWVDIDTLRALAWDFQTNRKGDKTDKGYQPILEEFKGGPARSAGITELGDDALVSRQLTIAYNDTLNIGPVYQVSFLVKEGVKGSKGQITPIKDSKVFVKEQINIPVATARKLGCRISSYLTAKESAALTLHYRE